jgi:hypothetical protein
LDYHEKRVLHWKGIVLHYEGECNTKHHVCNTVREEFLKQGRGQKETRRMDMNWVESKSKQLINEGIIVTPKELYNFCTRKD